jgi:hypothetical protein
MVFLIPLIDAGLPCLPAAEAKKIADRVARLIAQLDDDRFRVREAATKELKQIGSPTEKALRRALTESESAEVRRRAADILRFALRLVAGQSATGSSCSRPDDVTRKRRSPTNRRNARTSPNNCPRFRGPSEEGESGRADAAAVKAMDNGDKDLPRHFSRLQDNRSVESTRVPIIRVPRRDAPRNRLPRRR